jgi:hypothetical protein
MPTTIRVTRQTPFTKSDALREDAELFAEAQELGVWLAERDIATVTMGEVLQFERIEHPGAQLARGEVEYFWEWDPKEEMYFLVCVDTGRVTYHLPEQSDGIVIEIEISARY